MTPESWKRCSSCKDPIPFQSAYWACSVSTCNRKRTALAFCSVQCWDAHLPVVSHRPDAGAVERHAPSRAEWQREQAASSAKAEREPRRVLPSPARTAAPSPSTTSTASMASTAPTAATSSPEPRDSADLPREILIVASKLKSYVRARSGMNTSDRALVPLSDAVRRLCDEAIDRAREAERKTVLDRDFD